MFCHLLYMLELLQTFQIKDDCITVEDTGNSKCEKGLEYVKTQNQFKEKFIITSVNKEWLEQVMRELSRCWRLKRRLSLPSRFSLFIYLLALVLRPRLDTIAWFNNVLTRVELSYKKNPHNQVPLANFLGDIYSFSVFSLFLQTRGQSI